MIIRNNKTKREYPVTPEGWKAIERKGWAKNFTVVGAGAPARLPRKPLRTSFIPAEVATTDDASGKKLLKDKGQNKNSKN